MRYLRGNQSWRKATKEMVALLGLKLEHQKGIFTLGLYMGAWRRKRIALWKWMKLNMDKGNWCINGDFNQTEWVDDLVGPFYLLHRIEICAWNRVLDKFELIDNRFISILKTGPHFTRQAIYGMRLDQSRIDRAMLAIRLTG